MYTTILVPHAGTPAGDDALNHAIHAAKNTSAKIILLHVVEEIQHPPSFGLASSEREKLIDSIDEANQSIKAEMEAELSKRIIQCKDNGVSAEVKVVIGDAADIIMRMIQEENTDLVVMAKRRKLKGVKKLLSLGSVSRKIVENVNCPVLLIDTEGKMIKTFDNILVPYNGTSGSDKAFKKAVALASVTKSKITVITCIEEKPAFGFFKTKTSKQEFAKECQLIAKQHKTLSKYTEEHGISFNSKIVKGGMASTKILEYAKQHDNDIDLVIMTKTKISSRYEKMHYQSTIENVFRNANCPILIL